METAGMNKKTVIYETLKKRIIRNELRPLEYLHEKELCRELGTSKTPIREALQELERNRFVFIVPNKGCFVSNISIDDIREVFEIREIHECAAARIVSTQEDRSQFVRLLGDYTLLDPDTEQNPRERLLSGYQIHTRIVEAVGNGRLKEFYKTLQDHIVRIRIYFINRFDMKRLHETDEEHKAILSAIAQGDAASAEAEMRKHLRNALFSIRQLI